MFQPLPADTVFEAKRRNQKQTLILFFCLAFIYIFFFNLFGFSFFYGDEKITEFIPHVIFWSSFVGILIAVVHFQWARSATLDQMLGHLEAKEADANDDACRIFINIVREAETAIGSGSIRAVTLSTTAVNAFSLQDSEGRSAIGVTEGLLARLDRSELSSVIAHEAAHLCHEDSRLMAITCSLVSVFDSIYGILKTGRRTVLISMIAWCGRLTTSILYMAISRNREHYADCDAVAMTKDPASLSEALKKISAGYRGYLNVPEGFSSIFIMDPTESALNEETGVAADLFATHPPIADRLKNLSKWIHQDASDFKSKVVSGEGLNSYQFIAHNQGNWQGPFSPADVAGAGIQPTTLIFPVGVDGLAPGSAINFDQIRKQYLTETAKSDKGNCPRCRLPLAEDRYEGLPIARCVHCQGKLVHSDDIQKIIVRPIERFSQKAIEDSKQWCLARRGTLRDLCRLPRINCPSCGSEMSKYFYSEFTKVVVDRCTNESCRMIWCDANELELIQALVESYAGKSSPGGKA